MSTEPRAAEADVHRALSSPTRRRLRSMLQQEDHPQAVPALAERTGLHPNTVRAHLGVLEEAGLVRSAREERDRPGRPRVVYSAVERPEDPEEAGYRFLARMLAGHVAVTAADPAAEATSLGTAWGRHLTPRPAPSRPVAPTEAVTTLVDMLDELGFSPELDPEEEATPRLRLRRCPFVEVAQDQQEVVCSIHLGLMRGAMEELGAIVAVEDLIPFAEPDACVSHLAVAR